MGLRVALLVSTAGATCRLRLLSAQCAYVAAGNPLLRFPPVSRYANESHTSVVGMRGSALAASAEVAAADIRGVSAASPPSGAAGEPALVGWQVTADRIQGGGSEDGVGGALEEPLSEFFPGAAASADAPRDSSPVDDPSCAPCCSGRNGHPPYTAFAGAAWRKRSRHSISLFALPAECNFTGARLDLALIPALQSRGWAVVLDAAKACATDPPDLSRWKPEFVVLSYYKAR